MCVSDGTTDAMKPVRHKRQREWYVEVTEGPPTYTRGGLHDSVSTGRLAAACSVCLPFWISMCLSDGTTDAMPTRPDKR